MRIVGGEWRGRTLRAVPGDATRPTADRVRQSLFDLLGQRCEGLRVLDLYAGTGALALEALSRGAASAVLIEHDKKAAEVIARNIADLRCEHLCKLLRDDVTRALSRLGPGAFDLIFSDPPYALHAAQRTLDAVAALLSPGGRAVLERDKREPRPVPPAGVSVADERSYGDTVIVVAQRDAP